MKRLLFVVVACMVVALPLHSLARITDGKTVTNPVIASIWEILDIARIDVRNRNPTDTRPVSERPQLTELINFQSDLTDVALSDPFQIAFGFGTRSDRAYLIAVNSLGTPQPQELQDFKRAWDSAAEAQRVFISFSGKDLLHARVIADALRYRGYIVFLFKDRETSLPMVNPVETGQFFKSARHHLVLDTPNARRSPAVLAEYRELMGEPKSPPLVMEVPMRQSGRRTITAGKSLSVPCCKLCTKTSPLSPWRCEPPVCDMVICQDARDETNLDFENGPISIR